METRQPERCRSGRRGFPIVAEKRRDSRANRVGWWYVNGDGLADLLLGAPSDGGTGAAYVVSGKADTASVDLDDLQPAAVATSSSAAMPARAPGSGANIGDLNNDGRSDQLIGAPMNDIGGFNVGVAYVSFGKPTAPPSTSSSPRGGPGRRHRWLLGDRGPVGNLRGRLGFGRGDVNGDGRPTSCSEPKATTRGVDAGAAYVVFVPTQDQWLDPSSRGQRG